MPAAGQIVAHAAFARGLAFFLVKKEAKKHPCGKTAFGLFFKSKDWTFTLRGMIGLTNLHIVTLRGKICLTSLHKLFESVDWHPGRS